MNSFGNILNRLLKLTFSIRIQCETHKLPLLDFSLEHVKRKIDIVDIYFNTLYHIYLLAMTNTLEIIVWLILLLLLIRWGWRHGHMPGTHVELGKRTTCGGVGTCQAHMWNSVREQHIAVPWFAKQQRSYQKDPKTALGVMFRLNWDPFPSPLSLYQNQFKFIKGINIKNLKLCN